MRKFLKINAAVSAGVGVAYVIGGAAYGIVKVANVAGFGATFAVFATGSAGDWIQLALVAGIGAGIIAGITFAALLACYGVYRLYRWHQRGNSKLHRAANAWRDL